MLEVADRIMRTSRTVMLLNSTIRKGINVKVQVFPNSVKGWGESSLQWMGIGNFAAGFSCLVVGT